MRIHAWLEERDLTGLEAPLRARITIVTPPGTTPADPTTGAGSLVQLHQTLDEVLVDAGLIDGPPLDIRGEGTS